MGSYLRNCSIPGPTRGAKFLQYELSENGRPGWVCIFDGEEGQGQRIGGERMVRDGPPPARIQSESQLIAPRRCLKVSLGPNSRLGSVPGSRSSLLGGRSIAVSGIRINLATCCDKQGLPVDRQIHRLIHTDRTKDLWLKKRGEIQNIDAQNRRCVYVTSLNYN